MNRVSARIAVTAVLAPAASILLTVVNVYATDKPGNPGHHYGEISNPGHHYGQLKHMAAPPPPSTNQVPPSGTQTAPPAATPTGLGRLSGNGARDDQGAASTTAALSDAPAVLPIANTAQETRPAPAGNYDDGLSWLVLLILPLLLAVWLWLVARGALTAGRLRKGVAPAA